VTSIFRGSEKSRLRPLLNDSKEHHGQDLVERLLEQDGCLNGREAALYSMTFDGYLGGRY